MTLSWFSLFLVCVTVCDFVIKVLKRGQLPTLPGWKSNLATKTYKDTELLERSEGGSGMQAGSCDSRLSTLPLSVDTQQIETL